MEHSGNAVLEVGHNHISISDGDFEPGNEPARSFH